MCRQNLSCAKMDAFYSCNALLLSGRDDIFIISGDGKMLFRIPHFQIFFGCKKHLLNTMSILWNLQEEIKRSFAIAKMTLVIIMVKSFSVDIGVKETFLQI